MAAPISEHKALESLFECAVCLNRYDNPRELVCAHQFCLRCLEDVFGTQGTRTIPCPTCRQVTPLPPAKDVSDLPKPVLVNKLQATIAPYFESRKRLTDVTVCDICVGVKGTASFFCGKCRKTFCEPCKKAKHSELEDIADHAAVPISMICKSHSRGEVIMYCHDCNVCVCAECIMGDHLPHNTQMLGELADHCRMQLITFLEEEDNLEAECQVAALINARLTAAKDSRRRFRNSAVNIKQQIKAFENKFDEVEKDIEAKLTSVIQTLTARGSDAERLISHKKNMIEEAISLKDTADHELVVRAKKFPSWCKITSEHVLGAEGIELPRFEEKFADVASTINKTVNSCNALWGGLYIDLNPLGDFAKKGIIVCGHFVTGISLDSVREKLVVRTRDSSAPIKVYSLKGILEEELGVGLEGVVDGYDGKIDIDTKRYLYLVPCEKALKILDKRGVVQASIQIGRNPSDVAYSKETDSYVVSDAGHGAGHGAVYVINAETKHIITQLRPHGDTALKCPENICVGRVAGFDKPVVVVSDCVFGNVNVFDITGHHLKTFGSQGNGGGELLYPLGVSIDPAGRILVCDWTNKRLVSFWMENTQDKWRYLLGREHYIHVAVDAVTRSMALCRDYYKIDIYQG